MGKYSLKFLCFFIILSEFEHDGENYISTVVPHDFLDKLERGEKEIIEEEEESSCQYQCSVCPDVEIESLKELKEHLTSPVC